MRTVRFGTVLAVVVGVLFTGTAHAQVDFYWITAGDGSFQDPFNWDNGIDPVGTVSPGFFDSPQHNIGDISYTVTSSTFNEGIIDVGSIIVTSGNVTYDLDGMTLFANGGPTQSNFGLGVFPGVGDASLTLLDGTYDIATSLGVSADPLGPASATMTFGAGATVRTGTLVEAADIIAIGGGHAGTLNVIDGALYDAFQPQVGNDAGDIGILNVSGPGSILDNINPGAGAPNAHAMAIGLDGTGILNITNGGLVRTQFLGVAGGFGTGTVNVDNATLMHEAAFDTAGAGTIVVIGGGFGDATLNLTNNTLFATDFLVIASGSIAGNSTTINVMSGSDWTSSQWRLGEDVGDSATMNVDGVGTTMLADFGCFIGYNGSGEFNVTNGATARFLPTATAGTGFLGLGRIGSGSSGTMTVDGIGSIVSVEGALANGISIGRDGVGNATVSNGGLLTTVPGGDISIGRTAAAVGTLSVTGTGAIARGHNGINVGGTASVAGLSGTLNITNGGSIETTNMVIHAGDIANLSGGGFGTIGTIGTVINTANTLTIRAGGTLRGNGTINGNVAVVTGGTLSPGLSPGLLTVNGDLNLGNCVTGAGGTYNMEIVASGTAGVNYDSMVVSGSVLLGGTLNLIVAGSYVPSGSHQFNVITGSSDIVGAVQSITNRVINPATIGGTVWGDYREDNSGVGTDRYYLAPRRNADFNGVGGVTGADYTTWADNFGRTWATFGEGDANGDRQVTGADFTLWADNFGLSSLDSDGVAVNTYGYGVDAAAFDVDVTPDPEFDVALNGIRTMQRLSGAGILDVAGGRVSSVPEPSSLVLGALATVALALFGLRRRSS